jgi:hypothetical protein
MIGQKVRASATDRSDWRSPCGRFFGSGRISFSRYRPLGVAVLSHWPRDELRIAGERSLIEFNEVGRPEVNVAPEPEGDSYGDARCPPMM